ncbi:MAG: LD-carboxypeptidase [Thermoanaerobaculales bacterium]|nr:LD-carboxypeptidase [Thermoanaerobaculales bacterium]
MRGEFRPMGPDEPIGVAALSGPVDEDRLEAGLAVLRSWGRPIVEAPNLRARMGYLAGTDDERLRGLRFLLNQDVRLIIAARGGYGVTRLLHDMPWERLVEAGVS